MRLHVRYRVSPHANIKPRPEWFTKRLALLSLLAALDEVRDSCDVVVTYVANGGAPAELEDLVAATGEVQPIVARSAPQAFRRLIDIAADGVPPGDLVWLAEDDYLYRPEAMKDLVAAARAVPDADYFGLYRPDNRAWHASHPSQPHRSGPRFTRAVGDRVWETCRASNATYGVRAFVLKQDARVLQLCSLAGAGWDNATLCAVQGVAPYDLRHVHRDLMPPTSVGGAVRCVAQPVLRGVVDAMAALRGRRRRTWIATQDDLATHCELGYISEGFDWGAYASTLRERVP